MASLLHSSRVKAHKLATSSSAIAAGMPKDYTDHKAKLTRLSADLAKLEKHVASVDGRWGDLLDSHRAFAADAADAYPQADALNDALAVARQRAHDVHRDISSKKDAGHPTRSEAAKLAAYRADIDALLAECPAVETKFVEVRRYEDKTGKLSAKASKAASAASSAASPPTSDGEKPADKAAVHERRRSDAAAAKAARNQDKRDKATDELHVATNDLVHRMRTAFAKNPSVFQSVHSAYWHIQNGACDVVSANVRRVITAAAGLHVDDLPVPPKPVPVPRAAPPAPETTDTPASAVAPTPPVVAATAAPTASDKDTPAAAVDEFEGATDVHDKGVSPLAAVASGVAAAPVAAAVAASDTMKDKSATADTTPVTKDSTVSEVATKGTNAVKDGAAAVGAGAAAAAATVAGGVSAAASKGKSDEDEADKPEKMSMFKRLSMRTRKSSKNVADKTKESAQNALPAAVTPSEKAKDVEVTAAEKVTDAELKAKQVTDDTKNTLAEKGESAKAAVTGKSGDADPVVKSGTEVEQADTSAEVTSRTGTTAAGAADMDMPGTTVIDEAPEVESKFVDPAVIEGNTGPVEEAEATLSPAAVPAADTEDVVVEKVDEGLNPMAQAAVAPEDVVVASETTAPEKAVASVPIVEEAVAVPDSVEPVAEKSLPEEVNVDTKPSVVTTGLTESKPVEDTVVVDAPEVVPTENPTTVVQDASDKDITSGDMDNSIVEKSDEVAVAPKSDEDPTKPEKKSAMEKVVDKTGEIVPKTVESGKEGAEKAAAKSKETSGKFASKVKSFVSKRRSKKNSPVA